MRDFQNATCDQFGVTHLQHKVGSIIHRPTLPTQNVSEMYF